MKANKWLALALALVLALGLAVPALGAETATHADYADLMVINPYTNSPMWEWAWPTIDDTIRRGLFIGYTPTTDAQGNTITKFGPGDAVTESVGLTLCARMMADKDQREAMLKDRLAQMRELIPGTEANPDDPNAPFVWFRREAAACLELGIVEAEDIEFLRDADRLGKPMTKADFAKYLVRAMGLEDFAESMKADTLPFTDEATIGREYRPYVKLLSTYGVLTGDENGNFNPNDSMNRAVCATMLSRAIENIQEEREVTVDLPRYTTYQWTEGYIQSVKLEEDGSRTMVIKSDISGAHTVTLPSGVSIYQYNMKATATELKVGTFAKVCYNGTGKVNMVRLTPAGFLSPLEGVCDDVTLNTVTVDGVTYSIDRFTEVKAGGKTGDRAVIDLEAGYTQAKLVANSRKSVLSLELSGGNRQVEGILTDVTTKNLGATTQTTATVNDFNGLPTTYVVPEGMAVTVDGRDTEALQKSFVGKRVVLRVFDEDPTQLKSVEVDSVNHYVQGILGYVNHSVDPVRVEILRSGDAKRTPYEMDPECVITYEGEAKKALKDVPLNTFVTALVEGGTVTNLSAWTGMETTKGTLTGLNYADPTVLKVTKEDGTVSEFSIPMSELTGVTVLVNGEDSNITKLNTGDQVEITLHYHDVTQIAVTPRSADVTGVLNAVTFNADGSATLTVRFQDGSTVDYTAGSTTTVLRAGKPVAMTELVNARGQSVSLVTEGKRALSVQFSGSATAQDTVEGTILSRDDKERIVTILVNDPNGGASKPVNVYIASGVNILDVTTNRLLPNSSRLEAGDTIVAYGAYAADGTFEAKSVVRK